MANKPIAMSKLRQVLKLYCQGQFKLQISTLTGLSRNTVKKYIHVFHGLRTTWEEIHLLSDKELDALFCNEPEPLVDTRLVVLHEFLKLQEPRLKQRGMTLFRLWEAYHVEYPDGFKITSFYRHYNLWNRRVHPSMHMDHKAGDKVFVDFTGEKLNVVDPASGELKAMEVFVAILGQVSSPMWKQQKVSVWKILSGVVRTGFTISVGPPMPLFLITSSLLSSKVIAMSQS